MNANNKSNLIASLIFAIAPFGPLALLLPSGDLVAGALVIAALIGMGVIEFRQSAVAQMPKPRGRIPLPLMRQSKSRA